MSSAGGYGTAIWSSANWQEAAVGWLDQQLDVLGILRTGPVEHPHIRPWATAIRVPTSSGVVWLKATGPGTSFEVRLYPVLARLAPDQVLTPMATDPQRGWMILPDGGRTIGERLTGRDLVDDLVSALVEYGRLQVSVAGHTTELLAAGVPDMRPAVMPQRFEQVLGTAWTAVQQTGRSDDLAKYHAVSQLRQAIGDWCGELAGSEVLPSLDHNDLHPWNILSRAGRDDADSAPGTEGMTGGAAGSSHRFRFYDWGDSVLAHPFAAMLVPLGFVQRLLGVSLDDPRFLRARDAYLEVFGHLAAGEDLPSTLETACRVAKIARVLTWERALTAAREHGDGMRADYQRAPLETLFSLLDDSYLGGS